MAQSEPPGPGRRGWSHRVEPRVTALLARARRRPSRQAERLLFAVSLLTFVGAAVVAAGRFPDAQPDIRWGLLAAAGLVGMPANIVLNAAEFHIIGRFVNQRVPAARAVKVTVLGSAANLLPIPGSTLVRVQALVADKARYRDAIAASIAVGVLSVGANLILAGLAQAQRAPATVVLGLVGAGVAVTAIALAAVATVRSHAPTARLSWAAFGIEVLYASVSAVRLWVILLALGLEVPLASAFALAATGSLATAVGFFPAGLGIREALIGAISPLVGLPLAAGLAGAVVERLFWFVVLAIAAGIILLRTGAKPSALTSGDPLGSPAGREP